MLKIVKIIFILTMSIAASGAVVDNYQIEIPMSSKSSEVPDLTIHSNIVVVDSEKEVGAEIQNVLHATQSHTIILSTHSSDLDKLALSARGENTDVILAPYGLSTGSRIPQTEAEKSKQSFMSLVRAYPSRIASAAMDDKIGLLILTIGTVHDSIVWMHTAPLSTFEKSANIIFTLATAIAFGVDKKAWATTTQPIQKMFRWAAGLTNTVMSNSDPRNLAIKFGASLLLATSINLGRVFFTSMDHITDVAMSVGHLTTPLLLSVFSTVASFAWSEHIATIDSSNKTTQFVFRRIHEMRGLFLGMFATTAQLMNPSLYGISSWVALGVTGIAGLYVYTNAEKVNSFIQASPVLKRFTSRLEPIYHESLSCSSVLEFY